MSSEVLHPIYSDFGDDPELSELVEMFVSEIPERVKLLTEAEADSDWETVGRVAHQIKGAAGSYGFGEITPFAARLENACRLDEGEETIREHLSALQATCKMLRAGSPQ